MTLMIDRVADLAATLEHDPELAARVVGSRMEVFDITNVAAYVGSDDKFNAFDHPCGPPFDLYWMEFATSAITDFVRPEYGEGIGMLCVADEDDGTPIVHLSLYLMQHKKVRGPVTTWTAEFPKDDAPWIRVRHPVADWFIVEKGAHASNGPEAHRMKGDVAKIYADHPEWADMSHEEVSAELVKIAEFYKIKVVESQADIDFLNGALVNYAVFACFQIVLGAHAFLACRNVSTDTITPPGKVSAKHLRRHGKPLVRYKVLKIAAMGRRSTGSSKGGTAELSLHIVRGHFKTFTPERPLFGSRTGVYWWSQNLRGDKKNGVIVKDYEMGKPA